MPSLFDQRNLRPQTGGFSRLLQRRPKRAAGTVPPAQPGQGFSSLFNMLPLHTGSTPSVATLPPHTGRTPEILTPPEAFPSPPGGPSRSESGGGEVNQHTARNYDGSPFFLGEAIPFRAFHETASTGPKTSGGHALGDVTQHGMWRLDVSLSGGGWQWKWWAGNVSGLSRVYNSDIRPDVTSPDDSFSLFGGEAPGDIVEGAEEEADTAEKDFRDKIQPLLDDLIELSTGPFPEVPDVSGLTGELQTLSGLMGGPLSQAEQNEAISQAAIAAGFFDLDANGNVVADIPGYQAAANRVNNPDQFAPQIGAVARTPLQQRQLRMQRQRDIGLAQNMFSDVAGESFAVYMNAVHSVTSDVANADLQRQMMIDDQNWERAVLIFQSENESLQNAVNLGQLTYAQALDRRERQLVNQQGIIMDQAALMFQQYGAELGAIAQRAGLLSTAIMTQMGFEQAALDIWQTAFDNAMAPFWEEVNLEGALDLLDDDEDTGMTPMEWAGLGVKILEGIGVILGILEGLGVFGNSGE